MLDLTLPHSSRGRKSAKAQAEYDAQCTRFANSMVEIAQGLDFQIGVRGWAYLLEQRGVIEKGDFPKAERLIAQLRKDGILPLWVVAEDSARQFDNLEYLDSTTVEDEADWIVDQVSKAHLNYNPLSLWDNQPVYIEMMVEKIDLKSLFTSVCSKYHIPIANGRGSSDINSRAAMMKRFANHEAEGRQCVLLYAGDHDPSGLAISETLAKNLADLERAVGWSPHNLIVDRFGLNEDFIEANGLTWIDGLQTGSGRNLEDHRHPDHGKPYVTSYLARFGARKVEANALVTAPEAGRELCRQAILKYLDEDAIDDFHRKTAIARQEVKAAVAQRMAQGGTHG